MPALTVRGRSRVRPRTLAALLLVDAPALAAVAIFGHSHGYAATYEAISAWRLAHPWSLLPSVVVAVLCVRRLVRRRQLARAGLGASDA